MESSCNMVYFGSSILRSLICVPISVSVFSSICPTSSQSDNAHMQLSANSDSRVMSQLFSQSLRLVRAGQLHR
eukprot:COSAG01_NODE_5353_length_4315_cov_32.988852_5_plen_73_part_00